MRKQKIFGKVAAMGVAFVLGVQTLSAAELDFRTDINPALLYFQGFQSFPQLSEPDSKYLFEEWSGGAWPDEPLDERRISLLKQYDNTFKAVRRARFSKVPCDWGYDLSDGAEALLTGLAPAKRVSQVARLRAMVALDANEFDRARQDLLAAYALGRNVATDRILISCLVQFAMENIVNSVLLENYYRLSADQLDQLIAGFDASPRRGTIADTISGTERDAFYGYLSKKVKGLIAETNGDNDLFWKRFEAFWNPLATEAESKTGPDPNAETVKQAAGGSPANVLKLLEEMPPLYNESARVLGLPYALYKTEAPALFARIDASPNPFIKQFFSVLKNIRGKEFAAMVQQQMIRAAAAYKRGGTAALKSIEDPLVGGPFEFTRTTFEGVDRGFQLRSREQFRDFNEVMIFLEKPGRHFRLSGKNAGKAY